MTIPVSARLAPFVTAERRELGGPAAVCQLASRGCDGQRASAATNAVCTPNYELCLIDGSENWTIDGDTFFLVDELLRPGGLVVFDDYSWTYALADRRRDARDGVSHRQLSPDELNTPAVREIFELLVKRHPDYAEFELYPIEDWAVARKVKSEQKRYRVSYGAGPVGIQDMLGDAVMRLIRTAVFRPRYRGPLESSLAVSASW